MRFVAAASLRANVWVSSRKYFHSIPFTFTVAEDLKNLIIKLLRKNRKTVHLDKWEHAVSKFCYEYSAQDAWEIERFGYKKASLTVKLRVLKVCFCYFAILNINFFIIIRK